MQEIDLATKKPELKKLLLIGNEGTGKTNFIGTMPKPIYLFSFDKGYDTLAGTPGITVGLFMDMDRYNPKAYVEFRAKWEELRKGKKYKWADGREEPYATIAIDSLTALSKAMFDHEQKVNNTTDRPAGYGPYMNTKSKLQDVVTQGVFMAEHFVCTAILQTEKDEITGEIFFKPSTEGSFRDEAGQWFDAVFYMEIVKGSTGEKKYQMLTVGDRRQKAKIRLPSNIGNVISAIEIPSYQGLVAKIDAALAQSQTINEGVKK